MTLSPLVYFTPSASQLLGLAALLTTGAILAGLGAAAAGPHRQAPADIVVGCGIAGLLFTAYGSLAALPFTYLFLAVLLAAPVAFYAAWKRGGPLAAAGWVKVLLLTLPLWLLVAAMAPSQWDEFSHWLLSARYLVDHDLFPGVGRPTAIQDYPAYPYGVPLISYLASRLARHFVDNAGPLFNVLLLLSFGLQMAALVRRRLGLAQAAPLSWALAAFAVLAVTGLNPTFVQKIVLTAYADLPTSVATGFAVLLGWYLLGALADGDEPAADACALQMGFALAMLINAKQANLVLVVFILAGLVLAALRDPRVPVAGLARRAVRVLGPVAATYLLWRYHVASELAAVDRGVMPFASWNIAEIPRILVSMATIMAKKSAYAVVMLAVIGLAVRALWRCRNDFDRLALVVGTTAIGYNAFLFFAYVAIFGGYEGVRTASYWRFNLHLGMLAVIVIAVGGAALWQRWSAGLRRLPWLPIVLVLALPVAFAPKLRFDLQPVKLYATEVGHDLARTLPRGSRLAVVDPLGTGFYAKYMRYLVYGVARLSGDVNLFGTPDKAAITRAVSGADYVWVHTRNQAADAFFGLALPARASSLLARRGAGWTLVKSWPYPGYDNPADVPD